jgi:hypothetical protein
MDKYKYLVLRGPLQRGMDGWSGLASSAAMVDAMEPDDLLTLVTATQQGGRQELEDGSWARERISWRLCSKAVLLW